jgi:anti-sigma B factor antagonist
MDDLSNIDVPTTSIADGVVLRPQGEIDLSRAPEFRQAIGRAQGQKPSRLIIDLSDVPYMDSSGVATLVEAMQTARRTDGRLILCGLQERVQSIFEIARLDIVFTIVESCEEAERL